MASILPTGKYVAIPITPDLYEQLSPIFTQGFLILTYFTPEAIYVSYPRNAPSLPSTHLLSVPLPPLPMDVTPMTKPPAPRRRRRQAAKKVSLAPHSNPLTSTSHSPNLSSSLQSPVAVLERWIASQDDNARAPRQSPPPLDIQMPVLASAFEWSTPRRARVMSATY